jgi:hypothetical protein
MVWFAVLAVPFVLLGLCAIAAATMAARCDRAHPSRLELEARRASAAVSDAAGLPETAPAFRAY